MRTKTEKEAREEKSLIIYFDWDFFKSHSVRNGQQTASILQCQGQIEKKKKKTKNKEDEGETENEAGQGGLKVPSLDR